MSVEPWGIVSNCWTHHRDSGTLDDECRRSVDLGYRYVELRQGSLDGMEVRGATGPAWPVPEALGEFRLRHPHLEFNLAVEAPFQSRRFDGQDEEYLERCVAAAAALGPVATAGAPVLRLVDLSPPPVAPTGEQTDGLGVSCARLADRAHEFGCRLALENSRAPAGFTLAVLGAANDRRTPGTPPVALCWDPANQALQTLAPEDPVETAAGVRDILFEFHYKQILSASVQPDVGEGDLDWRLILRRLGEAAPAVPSLFEIPAGPDIWDRLERSRDYLRRIQVTA